MKKYAIYYLQVLVLTTAFFSSQGQGVVFQHGTWAEAKALAQKEHKLIFVDFYTDWCAPCKMMVKEVFPDSTLGVYYNEKFICIKINAEKSEGPALAKKYGVAGYPTLVFTNPAEEIVYKITGEAGPSELIDQAKIALTPHDDFEALKERYKQGNLNREELLRYINVLKARGNEKDAAEAFDKYFAMAPVVDAASYKMITNYARTTDNTAFRYLDQHKKEFETVAGKEKVEAYIHRMIVGDFIYRKYPSEAAYQAAKKELKTKITLNEKNELSMDIDHYLAAGDEASYMRCASILVNRYYYNDDFQISNILGGSYRIVKDPAYLDSTLVWAKKAVDIRDNALNNATLALVYNKLNNRELALKYINVSLADCKRDGDTYEQRIQLFKKTIEEGKQWGM